MKPNENVPFSKKKKRKGFVDLYHYSNVYSSGKLRPNVHVTRKRSLLQTIVRLGGKKKNLLIYKSADPRIPREAIGVLVMVHHVGLKVNW